MVKITETVYAAAPEGHLYAIEHDAHPGQQTHVHIMKPDEDVAQTNALCGIAIERTLPRYARLSHVCAGCLCISMAQTAARISVRWHVGIIPVTLQREVFAWPTEVTQKTHGYRYVSATGPFYSRGDADAWVSEELWHNPNMVDVSQVPSWRLLSCAKFWADSYLAGAEVTMGDYLPDTDYGTKLFVTSTLLHNPFAYGMFIAKLMSSAMNIGYGALTIRWANQLDTKIALYFNKPPEWAKADAE